MLMLAKRKKAVKNVFISDVAMSVCLSSFLSFSMFRILEESRLLTILVRGGRFLSGSVKLPGFIAAPQTFYITLGTRHAPGS
jgi:hypothetical protein